MNACKIPLTVASQALTGNSDGWALGWGLEICIPYRWFVWRGSLGHALNLYRPIEILHKPCLKFFASPCHPPTCIAVLATLMLGHRRYLEGALWQVKEPWGNGSKEYRFYPRQDILACGSSCSMSLACEVGPFCSIGGWRSSWRETLLVCSWAITGQTFSHSKRLVPLSSLKSFGFKACNFGAHLNTPPTFRKHNEMAELLHS